MNPSRTKVHPLVTKSPYSKARPATTKTTAPAPTRAAPAVTGAVGRLPGMLSVGTTTVVRPPVGAATPLVGGLQPGQGAAPVSVGMTSSVVGSGEAPVASEVLSAGGQ